MMDRRKGDQGLQGGGRCEGGTPKDWGRVSGLELWSARKKGSKLRTERSPKWEEELGSGEDDGGVREARECGTNSRRATVFDRG